MTELELFDALRSGAEVIYVSQGKIQLIKVKVVKKTESGTLEADVVY